MSRKVGFDRPDTERKSEPKRSIADSYLDEFRAKANARKTQNSTPTSSTAPKPRVRRNWFVIIFMSVWITFWTFGILMAFGMLLSGGPVVFMMIWIGGACFGWVIALGVIIKQLKGTPITDDGGAQ